MTKKEMRTKLLRYDGIGVKVTTLTGCTNYFFYENYIDAKGQPNDGISRAYKHFTHGEHLVFYSTKWAQQLEFKEYLILYHKLQKVVDEYPDNRTIQEHYEHYEDFIVKRLMKYTGFSERRAKRQILRNSISFNKFTGKAAL